MLGLLRLLIFEATTAGTADLSRVVTSGSRATAPSSKACWYKMTAATKAIAASAAWSRWSRSVTGRALPASR